MGCLCFAVAVAVVVAVAAAVVAAAVVAAAVVAAAAVVVAAANSSASDLDSFAAAGNAAWCSVASASCSPARQRSCSAGSCWRSNCSAGSLGSSGLVERTAVDAFAAVVPADSTEAVRSCSDESVFVDRRRLNAIDEPDEIATAAIETDDAAADELLDALAAVRGFRS